MADSKPPNDRDDDREQQRLYFQGGNERTNQGHESQYAQNGDSTQKNDFNMRERFKRYWPNSGVWTALFTGVLCLFTWFLFQVSKSSDETQRSSQRAFLSLVGVTLGARLGPHVGSKEWTSQEFGIHWGNSGATPAKGMLLRNNAKLWPDELPLGYEFPLQEKRGTGAAAPKGTYGINVQISKESLGQVWHEKGTVYLWGSVVYDDTFPGDPKRLSEYCVYITHLTVSPTGDTPKNTPPDIDDPTQRLVNFQWQTCQEHNCYDEDCKDYAERIKDARP